MGTPKDIQKLNQDPIEMSNLKRFKEMVISYGIDSTFVKQMLNSWITWNRIIPQDWKDLVTAVLEAGPQL